MIQASITGGSRTARPPGLVQRIFGRPASIPTSAMIGQPDPALGPAGISADFGSFADGAVSLRAASIRGLSHQVDGSLRQDTYAVMSHDGHLIVAVADGVGSAPYSHLGSMAAARAAVQMAAEGALPTVVVAAAIAAIHSQARAVEQPPSALATTLVVVNITIGAPDADWSVWAVEWGDSRASIYTPGEVVDGHPAWRRICPDPAADVANTVRALPLFPTPTTYAKTLWKPGEVLLTASDGVDSHLLASNHVGHGLAHAWSTAPEAYQFIADVGFERAGARDDRTAVALFRNPATGLAS